MDSQQYQIGHLLTYQSILKSALNSSIDIRKKTLVVVVFLFTVIREGPEGNQSSFFLSFFLSSNYSSDLYIYIYI